MDSTHYVTMQTAARGMVGGWSRQEKRNVVRYHSPVVDTSSSRSAMKIGHALSILPVGTYCYGN